MISVSDIASSPSLNHPDLLNVALGVRSQTVLEYSTSSMTREIYAFCWMAVDLGPVSLNFLSLRFS